MNVTKQMREAPQGVIFICSDTHYAPWAIKMAKKLRREDLQIKPQSWLNSRDYFCGREVPGIVIDPTAVLTDEQTRNYLEALTRVRLNKELIFDALGEIIDRIERCGASLELTNAVTLASDLRQAIGYPGNKYALERVLAALPTKTNREVEL